MSSRAAQGFEFALRAQSAAQEMADTVRAAEGQGPGSAASPAFAGQSRQQLDQGGVSYGSGFSPALVVSVLGEYPELAGDLHRQMTARFASAGKSMPSLAVVDAQPREAKHAGAGAGSGGGGGTGGATWMAPMATGTHAATGAARAATGATRGGQPGVGGAKSDRRRNSITSPLHQRTSKWDGEESEEQGKKLKPPKTKQPTKMFGNIT